MKLQVHTRRGWRDVISFGVDDTALVTRAALRLCLAARTAGDYSSMRLLDGQDTAVLELRGIGQGWQEPAASKGYTWVP